MKAFPTAHVEKTKKDVALKQYVVKEDTRVAPMLDKSDKYPSTNQLWELIFREYDLQHDKDGWEHDPEGNDLDEVQFYYKSKQEELQRDPLAFFDKMIGKLIRRGYYVDMLASNPAIRSFGRSSGPMCCFALVRQSDRQTDRTN